jgi:fermentation-respiration switch protein FrsA (DUF1100 family)
MTLWDRKHIPLRLSFRRLFFPVVLAALLFSFITAETEAAMENYFLYFPEPDLSMTPDNIRLPYEDVIFKAADDTELHGWFIPGKNRSPVVLFFHGNAGNISHRIDNLLRLNRLGLSVFIFDYRGYGRSQGEPSEQGIYNDARGALEWLAKRGYNRDDIIYFGRSIGAAVALQLAIEKPPNGLILESPFTSVAGMGKKHYPILYRLLGWLLKDRYDNEEKMSQLKAPLLLIHGTEDSIVPVNMGQTLFSLAAQPKQIYLINGADHNDGFYLDEGEYWGNWKTFLNQLN